MPRYALEIAYNGTSFFGWQAQKSHKTVQGELEQALYWVLRKPVKLMAAGRTDRGVHAEGQVAHFDVDEKIEAIDFMLRRVNAIIFPNIVVKRMAMVPDDFHARFSATARQYRYELASVLNPLKYEVLPVFYVQLDKNKLNDLAQLLIGKHDLSGFSKESEQHTHTICDIFEAGWEFPSDTGFIFRVKANRFLHHTVRGMVGTMTEVASGKMTEESFNKVLFEGRRDLCGATALAKGLVLEKIFYPTLILS